MSRTRARIALVCSCASRRRDLRATLELESHSIAEYSSLGDATPSLGLHQALVLDSNPGESDLYSACRSIRRLSNIGIIAVTGNNASQVRIDALNAGADDCVEERYVLAEIPARIRAVLRRIGRSQESPIRISLTDRAVNLRSRKIEGPGDEIRCLTPREFLVFRYLIDSHGAPVTNHELSKAIWGRDEDGDFEHVRIVISQLRRKLEQDQHRPRHLITERSVGYRFTAVVDCSAGQSEEQIGIRAMAPSLYTAVAKDQARSSSAAG